MEKLIFLGNVRYNYEFSFHETCNIKCLFLTKSFFKKTVSIASCFREKNHLEIKFLSEHDDFIISDSKPLL